jgi:hypothetical protein
LAREVSCEPGTLTTGAFDADFCEFTEVELPGQHPSIADECGGEFEGAVVDTHNSPARMQSKCRRGGSNAAWFRSVNRSRQA